MSAMVKEFREFIDKGNFIDLAVGFVMGVAVKDVINVIVNRVISPLLAYVLPGNSLETFGVFGPVEDGVQTGSIGAVILAVINFVATAAVLFLIVRSYNRFKRRKADEEAAEPEPDPEDVVLLREIRDSLAR